MSQRQAFVDLARAPGANISQICREFGISRKTGYKWLGRFQAEGAAGLQARSRRPHTSPSQTSDAIEALVVELRKQHPAWGARKLKRHLAEHGHEHLPSVSTVTAILRRHDQLDAQASAKHRPYQRFAMAAPNQLWQMDFKGDFALSGGGRCYPLTVLDDHARFLLGLQACGNQQRGTVQLALTAIFRDYGLPERMLMDNGAPWGDDPDSRHTQLTIWLVRLGIAISHGRPYHPQTQGKDERLHRTLNEELLSRISYPSLQAWQPAFDAWRQVYNTERPHDALNLDTPSQHYHPSPRPFPETLPPIGYPEGTVVRTVDVKGQISFRNRPRRVGKPFRGLPVALYPDSAHDGVWHIHFCHIHIRALDLADGK